MTKSTTLGQPPPKGGKASMLWWARWFLEDPTSYAAVNKLESVAFTRPATLTAAAWAQSGLQSVQFPHKYAAALMATDTSALSAEDIKLPWPAFEVLIPPGLIPPQGRLGNLSSVFLADLEHQNSGYILIQAFEGTTLSTQCIDVQSLLGLTELRDTEWGWEDEANSSVNQAQLNRASQMAYRLVLNTILDINSLPAAQRLALGESRKKNKDALGRPNPSTHVLGRAIDLDCRPEIHEYVTGARPSAPKSTWLVRGHWRQQACGQGYTQRRPRWIQPYFKGEGPMLVRGVRLGFKAESNT